MTKNVFIKITQIFIAIGMLILLFSHIDIGKINNLAQHTVPVYLICAFLLLAFQIIVAAYRWLMILRLTGFFPPVWQCIGSSALGTFINAVVPGGVGGDITRTWITARNGVPTRVAAYSVISDRILTLVGLGFIVAVVLLFYMLWTGEKPYSIYIVSLTIGIALLAGLAGLKQVSPVIKYFRIRLPLVFSPIIHLSMMINIIFQHPNKMIALIGIILLGHFMLFAGVILIAAGLQVSLSLQVIFIAIPIALLFSAIPITPGGWGIREGTMVLVLGEYQISAEAALGISIVFGILSTLAALPTATAWWFMRKNLVNETIINFAVSQ